jgi:hypothetical protein
MFLALPALGQAAGHGAQKVSNSSVSVAVEEHGADFSIVTPDGRTVLRAGCSVAAHGARLSCADYPQATTVTSNFTDDLGSGEQLLTKFTGAAGKPDIERVLRVYHDSPFGSVTLRVVNGTSGSITVHSLRVIDVNAPGANSHPTIDLGGPEARERVLSDSFSEDRPTERIYDLGKAPDYKSFDDVSEKLSGLHVGVGSQLIYNRESGRDLFMGALTSHRWLTIFHLATNQGANGAAVSSFTVDSTGTKEPEQHEALSKSKPADQMEASVEVKPGESLESEPLLFATGTDYHADLEAYGAAIAKVNHPRTVGRAPSGWWSWTSYYAGVTDGLVRTNAQWLAQNLRDTGYNYVLVDEGYQYARGEYETTDATHFPEGMAGVGRYVTQHGITFGVWTAPFEVSTRSWVYEHHKDWLVHNAAGEPIRILQPEIEELYALDPTNPGAQDYLRQTYRTLTHDWNVRYIKLDFMDDTAIEGVHYAPNTTAIEAQRIGLKVIREAVGEDVQLDKDGSAMLAPVGLVDEGRISTDTGHSFEPSKTAASGIAERYYMNRNFFVADPDAFTLTDQKGEGGAPGSTPSEAEVSIVLAAVAGGMFEIGDDLPLFTAEADRLKLARNFELLAMYKYGHAAVPLDLMSYDEADEQPSVFVLHEGRRQTMLAIFNWTESPRSHSFTAASLGLAPDHKYLATDALSTMPPAVASAAAFSFDPGMMTATLKDQPPHSVRLIKFIDQTVPATQLKFAIDGGSPALAGKPVKLAVRNLDPGNPIIDFGWSFGDGTFEKADSTSHTYTRAGTYTISVTAVGIDGSSLTETVPIEVTGAISPDFHPDQNRRAP